MNPMGITIRYNKLIITNDKSHGYSHFTYIKLVIEPLRSPMAIATITLGLSHGLLNHIENHKQHMGSTLSAVKVAYNASVAAAARAQAWEARGGAVSGAGTVGRFDQDDAGRLMIMP